MRLDSPQAPRSTTSKISTNVEDRVVRLYKFSCILGRGGTHMSIFAWIILGLLAGFIGSKLVNKQGEGMFLDIILGVIGAVVGGWLFNKFGAVGVTGLNLYSLLVAVIGAVVVLLIYHALRRAV